MSAYEKLIERCAYAAIKVGGGADRGWIGVNEAILAEILRTLEREARKTGNGTTSAHIFRQDLLAWLKQSPLAPPKD